MVDLGKHKRQPSQVVRSEKFSEHQALGLMILAPAAASTFQDVVKLFAAKHLRVPFAKKFGFQLAKPKKFAAPSIVAKDIVKKFLTASLSIAVSNDRSKLIAASQSGSASLRLTPYAALAGFANRKQSKLTTALQPGELRTELRLSTSA